MDRSWPQFPDQVPDWVGLAPTQPGAAVYVPAVSHFPLPGWPAKETVEYLLKLILLGLLLLSVPFLIGQLITNPRYVLEERGEHALRGNPVV